eukprot:scaffold107723_cov57-Phaeocystis_antarctica.AAC.2
MATVAHAEAVLCLVEVALKRQGDVREEVELEVVHGEVEVPHLGWVPHLGEHADADDEGHVAAQPLGHMGHETFVRGAPRELARRSEELVRVRGRGSGRGRVRVSGRTAVGARGGR